MTQDADKINPIKILFSVAAIISVVIGIAGCAPRNHPVVSKAFYYWRTTFNPSAEELEYIRRLNVRKLYVRFFDIDWDYSVNQPVPIGRIEAAGNNLPGCEIVPTVFITNRTLANIPRGSIAELASHITRMVDDVAGAQFHSTRISEIQLDCDWTDKTRETYFELIRQIRSRVNDRLIRLSATIRLHQVKYREITGVPPVDDAVLMFYNMGKIDDEKTANSILDLDAARGYIGTLDTYPLHLDIALPLYSWGVVARRGKVVHLLNNVSETDFSDSTRFICRERSVEVVKSTYFNYVYLYQGDRIRLEKISMNNLDKAVDMLKPHIHSSTLSVIFFHLDYSTLKPYTYENLQTLCADFR